MTDTKRQELILSLLGGILTAQFDGTRTPQIIDRVVIDDKGHVVIEGTYPDGCVFHSKRSGTPDQVLDGYISSL